MRGERYLTRRNLLVERCSEQVILFWWWSWWAKRSYLLLVAVMASKAKPSPGRGGDCFCRNERSIAM